MPYYFILIVLIGLAVTLHQLFKDDVEELSRSRISNMVHTTISDDGKYALVMYNHDKYDEAQLSWAYSNAKGLRNVRYRNTFFYNIGSGALSKVIINNTFTRIDSDKFTILNGYPSKNRISYMFIINYDNERIIFNTEIDN